MNEVLDGFGDGGRSEFGCESGIVGLREFSKETSSPDDEGESAGEEQHDGCNLIENGRSGPADHAGFIKDFQVLLDSRVGSFGLRPIGPTPRREADRIFLISL